MKLHAACCFAVTFFWMRKIKVEVVTHVNTKWLTLNQVTCATAGLLSTDSAKQN